MSFSRTALIENRDLERGVERTTEKAWKENKSSSELWYDEDEYFVFVCPVYEWKTPFYCRLLNKQDKTIVQREIRRVSPSSTK